MPRHRIVSRAAAARIMAALTTAAVCLAPLAPAAAARARLAGPAHAATSGSTPGPAASPKILTIATLAHVDSLSPFLALNVLPTEIHRLIYDFLTNYDPATDRSIGGLADRWSASADKLTWAYHIRSGATWSDGIGVTAKDAAWTLNLMMTNPAAATANGNFVANFQSVTAPDGSTLVIKLKKPQATMLALDIPIVPEHIWQSHVKDIATFNNDTSFPVVGDGPFILTSYKQDQYIVLTANKHYWRGAPKFSQITFRYYKDADAEVEALKKGEADFVSGLTPAQFNSLKGDTKITLNDGEGKQFYAVAINPGATATNGQAFGSGNPALKDRRVRDAIMHAINKQVLVSRALGGYGKQGGGYLPPIFAANHWAPGASQAMNYDPALAGRLLDEAGYTKGPDGMRRTPAGQPFTLRLLGLTDRTQDASNMIYVEEWLKAVGINVTTTMAAQSQAGSLEQAGNYDLAFDSWLVNPDPDYIFSVQTCADRPPSPGATVPGDDFVCDSSYDALYHAQLAEYDAARRIADFHALQQRIYTDAYINVLYYPDVLEAYRNDVIGSMEKQPQPGGIYWGQDGYWAWWSAVPVTAAPGPAGSGAGPIVAGVAAAVVILLAIPGGLYLVRRRRVAVAERE